jgi:uncharacterized membrane protein YcaP (DUF421 family)
MNFNLPLLLADDPSPMWATSIPWWHFIVRGIVVYLFLLIILRLTGKRQIGQLAPFDLVLLLVLSNAVQNSMNGGDNSVTGGLISATTLIAINAIVSNLTFNNKHLELLIEGQPRVLIHNGKLYEEALKREKLTHHELMSALRKNGCDCIEDVHSCILETDGGISVLPRQQKKTNGNGGTSQKPESPS